MKIVRVTEKQFIVLWDKALSHERGILPIPIRNIYFASRAVLVVTGDEAVTLQEYDPQLELESKHGFFTFLEPASDAV